MSFHVYLSKKIVVIRKMDVNVISELVTYIFMLLNYSTINLLIEMSFLLQGVIITKKELPTYL